MRPFTASWTNHDNSLHCNDDLDKASNRHEHFHNCKYHFLLVCAVQASSQRPTLCLADNWSPGSSNGLHMHGELELHDSTRNAQLYCNESIRSHIWKSYSISSVGGQSRPGRDNPSQRLSMVSIASHNPSWFPVCTHSIVCKVGGLRYDRTIVWRSIPYWRIFVWHSFYNRIHYPLWHGVQLYTTELLPAFLLFSPDWLHRWNRRRNVARMVLYLLFCTAGLALDSWSHGSHIQVMVLLLQFNTPWATQWEDRTCKIQVWQSRCLPARSLSVCRIFDRKWRMEKMVAATCGLVSYDYIRDLFRWRKCQPAEEGWCIATCCIDTHQGSRWWYPTVSTSYSKRTKRRSSCGWTVRTTPTLSRL